MPHPTIGNKPTTNRLFPQPAKLLSIVKAAAQPPVDTMVIEEVIDRIESLNCGIAKFWLKSDGWAPVAAAGLLGKSRLDWQASLSGLLSVWYETYKADRFDFGYTNRRTL